MIPQRVAIEGFLSYRDRVDFSFDGAPIWMLTGKNGAGKSTVFDAITFALYGVHRGSGSKVEMKELINRGCDKLMIEFDFLSGDDRYRVQRTVARKGSSTFQAWHLSGPNPPNRQRKGEQPVPGTNKERGLTTWVEQKLGLDGKAFKMSVLLEQGKSDALLSAEPKERHALLRQLVDLRRYVALEVGARSRLNEANGIVEHNKTELATLPVVTPAQVADQEARIVDAKGQINEARQCIETLQALKVYASRWRDLQSQQKEVGKKHQQIQELVTDADAIRRDAERLDILQKMLPSLQRVHQNRQSQRDHQQEVEAYKRKSMDLAATIARETPLVEKAESELARLQQEHEEARNSQYTALQRLNEMNAAVHQLDELERLHAAIMSCDEKLQLFPIDLDQQTEAAQHEVEELINLRTLLPYAQRYLDARQTWHETSLQFEDALQQQHEHDAYVGVARDRASAAHTVLDQARTHLGNMQSQKAVADRELKLIREQMERFEQVGTLPTCSYCGQPLSAEHLASERVRLDASLGERLQTAASAASAEVAGLKVLHEAEVHAKACDSEYNAALTASQETLGLGERLAHERGRLEVEGRKALDEMRKINSALFALPQANAIDRCFTQPNPTIADLDSISSRTHSYAAAQETLRTLRQRITEREGQRNSRQQFESQYRPLAEMYPESRVQAIRSEYHAAESEQLDAGKQLARVAPLLNKAKEHLEMASRQLQDVQKNRQEAEQKASAAELLTNNAQTLLDHEINGLPADWHVFARDMDDSQLTQLRTEIAALSDAEVRYLALQEAQNQLAQVEERLREIEAELKVIPADAQRPLEALLQEEEQARLRQESSEREHQQAANQLTVLESRRRRIKELSTETLALEKKSAHYRLIVKYLGSDYLQRFLLQQAESAIVAEANRVLDRCSGGALGLHLRSQPDEGTLQKAFDLMVENHDTQSTQAKMLPASLLSGSQRFRVAISLALAIGQYASSSGQGVESVIIDEGFGSLDHQGLRDMEDALRSLDGLIQRIILVSHQDEFAEAFPHRYAVRLENGASVAELSNGLESV